MTDLEIECKPTGRNGTAVLSARLGQDVLAVETVNLAKPRERSEFIAKLAEGRPGINSVALEIDLLKLAAELAARAPASVSREATPRAIAAEAEIDDARIVRPERIIEPEVGAITVAKVAPLGDRLIGSWQVYLRWTDGRRESSSLDHMIDLPGVPTEAPPVPQTSASVAPAQAAKLWVHPQPSNPTPGMTAAWSAKSRQAWLAGAAAPQPAEVFRRLCECFAHFLDFPSERAPGTTAMLALWTLLTYVYPAWDAVPYLFVGGPAGSGKSRVFEILSRLAFQPLSSSNLTAPALFRTLHDRGGTLLLDEAERLRQTQAPDVSDMLSMLLAGYKRGGQATRLVGVGSQWQTVYFDVWGPKALACIAGLPPALASRTIPIAMLRAAPDSPKPRRRIDADPAGWQRLRDELHELALEHNDEWLALASRADVCPEMSGRDYELWQPLLALAWWIESHGADGLHGVLQRHAVDTIEGARDDNMPDADMVLVQLLAEAVRLAGRPTPKELLLLAQRDSPETFGKWSPLGVRNRLKNYDLLPHKSHGRVVYSRITPELLQRIEKRYGIDLGMS